MGKKWLCLLLTITVMLSFSGCEALFFLAMVALDDDTESKADIVSYVEQHREDIVLCIEQNDFTGLDQCGIIKEINVEEDHIDFFCGGRGFGAETFYCGFYYSPDNDCNAIWCAPNGLLVQDGAGYSWQEGQGDNRYYVEEICDNFFYYEADF